ncbi:MAG: NAD-dependent epimerase/dehydratase family protein [bacterium]|nr:NAD-dependent epimerase/dehydratase family protein [bacterium]
MSKILVTGGKGFLGSHLVARLSALGETVRILARPESAGDEGSSSSVYRGDIRDPDAVDKAVQGVDKVVHLVSNFRKGGSDKKEAHDINVTGTENVLKACLKHDVKRLVHCSTIGVHGSVLTIPANETTAFNPGDLYQETKLVAEEMVWDFYKETALPITVIRPISMLGPGDLRMLKLFRMIQKGRFVVVGDGSPYFQPAYIDDVVQGFMLCLDHPGAVGETFIIGGEEYLPLRDLFRLIADELGVQPPRLRVPLAPVLALATLVETVCVPFGIEPPLHRRRVSFFQNNRAFSVAKAKEILGFQPRISLREGIRRTIAWYQEQGWL